MQGNDLSGFKHLNVVIGLESPDDVFLYRCAERQALAFFEEWFIFNSDRWTGHCDDRTPAHPAGVHERNIRFDLLVPHTLWHIDDVVVMVWKHPLADARFKQAIGRNRELVLQT